MDTCSLLPHQIETRDEASYTRSGWWESITLRETCFPAFLFPISSLWGPRTQHFQPQGGIMERHLWARCLLFQPLLCRDVPSLGFFSFFLSFFVFSFIFISWRLITLQCCRGFCHTLSWISHVFTCVPHPLSKERCHRPSLYPPCKGLLTLKSSHVSSPLDVERKGEITQ